MEGEKAHQLPDVQERGSESAEAQDVNMAAIKEKRAGDRPDCFNSTLQEILFVLTCTMAVSMTSFTVGAVIVITDQVGKDLGMSNAELTWISAASSLASGAFLLFFGSVADLFGRKSLFIGSLFLFAVFSLAAGFSRTPLTLDVLNGMMGLMSASAVPPAQGLLGVIYQKPSTRKNKVFACFSAGNPLGFVFGSIFSGIATHLFSWRASFWLLAIIYLAFTVVALFTVPTDTAAKEPLTWETVRRFDFVGTLLTVAGIGMFSAALSLGVDAPHGWKTPYVLILLLLGLLSLISFILWEHHTPHPMLPMAIWRDRDFTLLLSTLVLAFLAFPLQAFFLSLYMQRALHYSALTVALHLLPMAVAGVAVNVLAALLMHRVSNRILMLLGACAYVAAFALLALRRDASSYWALTFPSLVLVVVGADFEFTVVNMYVLSSLPPSQQSIAGGLLQAATKLTTAVGFGVGTALFNAVAASPAQSGYYRAQAWEPYAAVMWFGCGVCVVGVVLCFFLRVGRQGHAGDEEKSVGAGETGRGEGGEGESKRGVEVVMGEAAVAGEVLGKA